MFRPRRLDAAFALVCASWPVTTFAAGVTLGRTLAGISGWDWVTVLILSAVAGGVSLLQKMRAENAAYIAALQARKEGDPMPVEPRWPVFIASNLCAAFLAGACAFLGCESADIEDFMEALVIGLSAWAGAKLLDIASDGVVGAVKGFIAGAAGKQASS